jgi:hypothetical protein
MLISLLSSYIMQRGLNPWLFYEKREVFVVLCDARHINGQGPSAIMTAVALQASELKPLQFETFETIRSSK